MPSIARLFLKVAEKVYFVNFHSYLQINFSRNFEYLDFKEQALGGRSVEKTT
jgi:hypothetical protein